MLLRISHRLVFQGEPHAEGDGGHAAERAGEVIAVTLPLDVRTHAEVALQEFCDQRVRKSVRDKVRLEVVFRGDGATIYERRPPYVSSFIPAAENNEWTREAIAQFRYEAETNQWTLYSANRHGLWHEYDDRHPSERLEDLIAEVDADPTGIFWG